MERVVLFLKGICMGIADIIPGVSGGTLALILGIYTQLVNTIKGLHLRWVPVAVRWMKGGFQKDGWIALRSEFEAMNLPFLVVLGTGIFSAIVAGGLVIPTLLDRYPEVMRALFFGLILASVPVPLRMIETRGKKTVLVVAVTALLGLAIGFSATAPQRMMEAGISWRIVESSEAQTLKEISRRFPSAWPGEQLFWSQENEVLRLALAEEIETLGLSAPGEDLSQDREDVRARSLAYEELLIPQGVPVQIPQPGLLFVFLVGMIAICAMILPGISGSYLLLIFGAYYFVLNALKGVITGLVGLSLPPVALLYVATFSAGALVGLLSFARLMSFLLRTYPVPTLGLLVGLMVGCLRGIWPFQAMIDGQISNIWPAQFDGLVLSVLVAASVGAIVVTLLGILGRVKTVSPLKGQGQ